MAIFYSSHYQRVSMISPIRWWSPTSTFSTFSNLNKPLEVALGGRLVQELWQHIPEATTGKSNIPQKTGCMCPEVNCYWDLLGRLKRTAGRYLRYPFLSCKRLRIWLVFTIHAVFRYDLHLSTNFLMNRIQHKSSLKGCECIATD